MLQEILGVSQDEPSNERRWFHDDFFDLFLRQAGGELAGFELCYGVAASERALVWSRSHGFFHDGDASGSGEVIAARLLPGDPLDADPVIARFERAADGLPEALRLALRARLREYVVQKAEIPARRARFRRADWQQSGGEQSPKENRSRNR